MTTISNLHYFCSIAHISKPITNPDFYFRWNDHWELYDSNKDYPDGVFEASYRGPTRKYINEIYEDPEHLYVVAREKLSEEARVKLAPYCKCTRCTGWFAFMNGAIFECLKCDGGCSSDKTIKKARKSYFKSHKN